MTASQTRRVNSSAPLLLAIGVLLASTPWPLGSRFVWAGLGASAMIFAAAAPAVLLGDQHRLAQRQLLRPLLAFLVWTAALWAVGRSVYPYGTQVRWLQLASYALLIVYLGEALIDRVGRVRALIGIMLSTAILVHMFGIYQWALWDGRMIWNYEPPFGGTSPFGPFNNRNHYAGYAIATLGPGSGLALLARGRWRLLGIVATGIAVIGLLLSLSRSGFLAMLVLVATVGWTAYADRWAGSDWRQRLLWAGTGVLLLVLLGGALLGLLSFLDASDTVAARLATLARPFTERSATGRIQIWYDTIPMVAARPVGGWGLNTFAWSHLRFRSTGDDSLPQHAHNEYLEITAETGLVGAAICGWFLWTLLNQMRRTLSSASGDFDRAVRIGCLGSWAGILALAMTDFPTVIPATNLVLAVTAAIGCAAWSSD